MSDTDVPRFRDLKNVIGGLLAGYGLVAMACEMYFTGQWTSSAPASPDSAHGLIFHHLEHGRIFYFSAFQETSRFLLYCTSIPLVGIGIVIAPKKNFQFANKFFGKRVNYERDDPRNLLPWGGAAGALSALIIVFLIGPYFVHWLNSIGFVRAF